MDSQMRARPGLNPSSMPLGYRWLTKLGHAVLGTAIALVVLNYAFLAGGYLTGHQRMYMFDAILGWRVRPNLEGARTPYVTYTDVHGFRILPNEPRDTNKFDA